MKAIAACLLLVLAGCTAPDPPESISHVHGVVFAGDDILLATHSGLAVVAPDWSYEVRPGPDLMSLARTDDGTLYAGGHPAQITVDGPKHLGLARSTDGGRSWQSISKEGEVDLHALAGVGDDLWAFWGEALQHWNGTWRAEEAPGHVLSLAEIDGRLVAGTPDGAFRQDQGAWVRLGDLAPITGVAGNDAVLYAATSWGPDGAGYRSLDGGATWQSMPDFATAPYALHFATDPADASRAIAGAFDGAVYESLDSGASWTRRI